MDRASSRTPKDLPFLAHAKTHLHTLRMTRKTSLIAANLNGVRSFFATSGAASSCSQWPPSRIIPLSHIYGRQFLSFRMTNRDDRGGVDIGKLLVPNFFVLHGPSSLVRSSRSVNAPGVRSHMPKEVNNANTGGLDAF